MELEKRVCQTCGAEFVPKRKNQRNCRSSCPKEYKLIHGGGITRKGNTVTVSGALNCYMFFKGLL